MTKSSSLFAEYMNELRSKYILQLEIRQKEFIDFLNKLNKGNIFIYPKIKESVHKLAGSGKTYGFVKVSETSFGLQELLNENAEPGVIAKEVEKLLENIEEIIIATPNVEETPNIDNIRISTNLLERGGDIKRKPVLCVADDDPAIRDLIKKMLSGNARVIISSNGRKAFEAIKKNHPDIVILDDAMPHMTGIQILEKLKQSKEYKNIHVIMLTVNNRECDVRRAMSLGVVDYITKPFDYKILNARIHNLVNSVSNKCVLIIDSDETIREMLIYNLGVHEVNVLHAENGENALKLATEYKPDLIILEKEMLASDGEIIMKKIRDNPDISNIPILLLANSSQNSDDSENLQTGIDDSMLKPFKPEELVSRVILLLERKFSG